MVNNEIVPVRAGEVLPADLVDDAGIAHGCSVGSWFVGRGPLPAAVDEDPQHASN
jgi:hypothetical protein